jgi:REP element-mobilizing transposase RayT
MTLIQEQDRRTIDLDAAVVMPDHVHAIFRVIEPYTLSRVLQRIKGRSSRQINLILVVEVASGWWRASTTSSGMGRSWKRNSNTFVRIPPNRGWKIARAIISGSSRGRSQAEACGH